jgi:hypothetical protein
MKQLIAGVVLIIVIGIAGFFYRNVTEHVAPAGTASSANTNACTAEAKVCPDGTSVGRTGPSCTFAPCVLPNAEDAELGIGFAIPAGYTANDHAIGAEPSLSAVFDKPAASSTVPNSIFIRHYPIPTGKTANDVMLANTTHETSGIPAKSMTEFTLKTIGGKTYYVITVERFEGQVHTLYYLPRTNDVLRFEILEKNVTNWTDPKLDIFSLPEHQALERMLGTLQLQTT